MKDFIFKPGGIALVLFFVAGAIFASSNISHDYHIRKPVHQGVDMHIELKEASGLALSHAGKSLWTVSDNRTSVVFKMYLNGDEKDSESFEIMNFPFDKPDLEGVCLDKSGTYMYVVQEREMAILKIEVTPGSTNARLKQTVRLSEMNNYQTKVVPYLTGNENKGLEAIAYHTGNSKIYVLVEKAKDQNGKEGPLMIEISSDLKTITDSKLIGVSNGFASEDNDAIDGSGMDFYRASPDKNLFYIVSDEGKRLFLYSWKKNKAVLVKDLGYAHAEGVSFDEETGNLYIVTDEGDHDSKLYQYHQK